MTAQSLSKEEVVQNAIREISHIATLPEITLRIVELVEDPRSTAQDLNKVISGDPALCARILKVVNSSFYGLPGQIASINRAIVMLGLNAVKNIAIAASLAKLFRGGELSQNFSAKDLWVHSNATAVASKMIADALKLGLADEAFLGGLIHDLGIVVELQSNRDKLAEVITQTGLDAKGVPARDMLEVETAVLGASHQDFGVGLCEKWKFPKTFAWVTGFHHRPLDLPAENRTVTAIVHIADRLAGELGKTGGFRGDLVNLDIGPDVREELKLSLDKIEEIRKALPDQLKQAGNMLA